jgi:integrase
MATIEKRERRNGTVFKAVVRIHGFPPQRRTFKRLTDAKIWVQQTEADIRRGEFRNVISTAKSKTLQDAIDRYRSEVFARKAETTQRAEGSFLAYWERELGEYALAYIDADLISKKLGELEAAGDQRRKAAPVATAEGAHGKPKRGRTATRPAPAKLPPKSPKTMKHYRDTIALLFKYARQWGWTGSSPVDGVNKITKIRNERTRFLGDDERAALLAACKASENEHLYPVVVFALSTGARKGEVLDLTFNDLDLKRGSAILRDTKNGETRAVPIVKSLNGLLKDHLEKVKATYEKLEKIPPQRWVFPRADGQSPIDIRTAWETAREKAKIADFRFHDLRHSTASYLAMNGASLVEIAEVLGHKTLQMVKRYAHLSESHVKDLVERVNDKILPAQL